MEGIPGYVIRIGLHVSIRIVLVLYSIQVSQIKEKHINTQYGRNMLHHTSYISEMKINHKI